ncbi:MAG TPA: aminomethyl-transferring glycine dehydrogenase, partial [Gemmatimonadales bacterium]|nr:aminomethyl-transferring glycine dehydrogenase [Gemmatimonadales bacterium]
MPKTAAAPTAAPSGPHALGRAQEFGDTFTARHLGPRADEIQEMLGVLGYKTLDEFIDTVVPEGIRLRRPLDLPSALTEREALKALKAMGAKNRVFTSYIGMGYYNTFVPQVIQRNILENPGWYTAYTPYQAEIAQGRLEALLTFQTMTADLTGLPIATASLLDEGTAAAEAMWLAVASTNRGDHPVFLIDSNCHPQTIDVVRTRAEARGVEVVVTDPDHFAFDAKTAGCLVQYPGTDGHVRDFTALAAKAKAAGALVIAATDLLALTMLKAPGEWGADIAVGNSQRFGVPMGFGGPHAAFFTCTDALKRLIPGRIIGISKDRQGRPALRMALQTREQHIRREKATSNVCTAQVLLAVMAAMYAVYHGPEGIARIARRTHERATLLAEGLRRLRYRVVHEHFFDTVCVEVESWARPRILEAAHAKGINLRELSPTRLTISVDETTGLAELADLMAVFALNEALPFQLDAAAATGASAIPTALARTSAYLTHPVFHKYRSETAMLRYLRGLEAKDLSLTAAMIPLGSCTMKLNASTEMMSITWSEFGGLHPFAPADQTAGYQQLFKQLEAQLAEITGFHGVSLQPNAGSQGEFAGLLTIRAYHKARGDHHRTVCLIPSSAHGTNPASAVMAGFQVVVVKSTANGEVDLDDLRAKAAEHKANLGALMITYPSTHGVFEAGVKEVCKIVHEHGGQVYMDGANMNAQVGLCRPGDLGADVCHLNLHKTFAIPHGGGGPGMGPICCAPHLTPFLPGHPVVQVGGPQNCGTISAAPWGSAGILPISWAYINLLGREGVTLSTKVAILSANYIAHRLKGHYPVLYTGNKGLVAHECILDTRSFKQSAGVEVEDIAKRLIDFSFHPPTVSFPVAGTLMVEPTESEPLEELDRFIEAMIA